MIIVKVWCLPPNQTESALNTLHTAIVKALADIPNMGIKDERDMLCLFPSDLMAKGLGEEIFIEASGFKDKQVGTYIEMDDVSRTLGKTVLGIYPNARVVVKLEMKMDSWGHWDSIEEK